MPEIPEINPIELAEVMSSILEETAHVATPFADSEERLRLLGRFAELASADPKPSLTIVDR